MAATKDHKDPPPWEQPAPCMEFVPARKEMGEPLVIEPAHWESTFDCARARDVGATQCFCIEQAGIDAKRGYCSKHGGVCGCEDHSIRCCDGTVSPTCTCHQ